jgi:hypothetical protein
MAEQPTEVPPAGRPVSERLREAREELEAKLLRLEEDERDQPLSSGGTQPLTAADVERALGSAAAAGGDGEGAGLELDEQLARRRALDRPLVADSSNADDPFAELATETRELSDRLYETRDALKQERARADAAEQELVRLQMQNAVGLRELVSGGGGGDEGAPPLDGDTGAAYPARMHLTVRGLVEENTQLRAAATSLEERLLAAKLELALTQEELDRRTL